jgi:NAD(P)-dependent dehydrogenase (short-subunit alcohol dehydrogenase family)
MNQPLPGNAIVITGAFGALGAAVARAAVGNGARVGLIDRAEKAPAGLLQDCGPQTIVRAGVDLTVASDASRAIDAIHADFGCLDVLINIAGAFRWQTVSDGDSETWDLMNAVNLKTALHGSRAALKHLPRPGGRIINIGANAAIKAGAGMGPYAASKAGVHRLTESRHACQSVGHARRRLLQVGHACCVSRGHFIFSVGRCTSYHGGIDTRYRASLTIGRALNSYPFPNSTFRVADRLR